GGDASGGVGEEELTVVLDAAPPDRRLRHRRQVQRLHRGDVDRAHPGHRGRVGYWLPFAGGPMPESRFVAKLTEQIAYEFGASHQYPAIPAHSADETLPRLAAFFYRQALEERNHAMMMVQYLLDAGEKATIPGVDAPRTDFADTVEPVALALDQERRVS